MYVWIEKESSSHAKLTRMSTVSLLFDRLTNKSKIIVVHFRCLGTQSLRNPQHLGGFNLLTS